MSTAGAATAVTWHDVECGPYAADLPIWEQLADEARGSVLELGCGTGRVALHLARRGHEVLGLDTDPELVAALNARAEEAGVSVRALVGDATAFELDRTFALAIAPMQTIQILGGPARRRAMFERVAAHLEPGGRFAAAIVTGAHLEGDVAAEDGAAPLPDVREEDGWVYSSLPVAITTTNSNRIAIQRLRQVVSPGGELSEEEDLITLDVLSPAELAAETAPAGFSSLAEHEVEVSDRYIGSTVCVMERR